MNNTRLKLLIHPFLTGLFPVLALLARNIQEININAGVRALLFTLSMTTFLLVVFIFLLKDYVRGAILTSLTLFLFFSFELIGSILRDQGGVGVELSRIRYMLSFYTFIFLFSGAWLRKTKRDLFELTKILNFSFGVILLFPSLRIITNLNNSPIAPVPVLISPIEGLSLPQDQTPPDVYYILLDGYPRGDILNEVFEMDNTSFLNGLEDMGFYIADCSQTNYPSTRLAMASTLNSSFLDPEIIHFSSPTEEVTLNTILGNDLTTKSNKILDFMIQNGSVRGAFEELGYTIVSFETNFSWLRWTDADVFIKLPDDNSILTRDLTAFEYMLFRTTVAYIFSADIFAEYLPGKIYAEVITNSHNKKLITRTLHPLDMLPTVPQNVNSPKFVYAHINLPHRPYIFGPNGEWPDPFDLSLTEDETLNALLDQITYTNTRVLQIINEIQKSSEVPPIIILQGDHGPHIVWESFGSDRDNKAAILNAYYFPGVTASEILYDSISPVNTFRLIFNNFYNGNLEVLEDVSVWYPGGDEINLACE